MMPPTPLTQDNVQRLDQLKNILERQPDQKATTILQLTYQLLHLKPGQVEAVLPLIILCRLLTPGQIRSIVEILSLIPPKDQG